MDDQERDVQAPDLCRGVEAVVEHPVDGVERSDPRVAQQLADRGRRPLDDHAVHVGVARRELERGRRTERMAVDETATGIGLMPPQLLPRRFRILVHARLGERAAIAPAEAAVVDHQHRGAGGVHGGGHVHHARLGAPGSGQEQEDRRIPAVRQPPAMNERAAGAGAQPDLAIVDAEHPGGAWRRALRKVDEAVRAAPYERRPGRVGRGSRRRQCDADASNRLRHAAQRTPGARPPCHGRRCRPASGCLGLGSPARHPGRERRRPASPSEGRPVLRGGTWGRYQRGEERRRRGGYRARRALSAHAARRPTARSTIAHWNAYAAAACA